MARTKHRTKKQAAHSPTLTLDQPTSIRLGDLMLSDENVRKIYDAEGVQALAESIRTRGLLQSLSVRPVVADGKETGQFAVQAGGRRLRALIALMQRGELNDASAVPCIIKRRGSVADDSLAENSDRIDLHPLDEFRAYKAMADEGLSHDFIAAAHRVTSTFVRQRLRLAAASPVLLAAYQDDDIDLDQLMAYCLVDDQGRQERVYASLKDGYNNNAYTIRKMLAEDKIPLSDKRVRLVGVEAYEAAGGHVVRDLFSEGGEDGFLDDADLLAGLVDAKLTREREAYLARGWKWAIANLDFPYEEKRKLTRLKPIDVDLTVEEQDQLSANQARLDELNDLDDPREQDYADIERLETEIAAIEDKPRTYALEDIARGGVIITVDHNGAFSVELGFLTVADAKATTEQPDRNDGNPTGEADDVPAGKPLSDRLVQDLTSYRTAALRNALSRDPAIALITVVHAMALRQFYQYAGNVSCLQVSTTRSAFHNTDGIDDWKATCEFNTRDEDWKIRLPSEPDKLWQALLVMSADERSQLLAHSAAATVNAVREAHNSRSDAIRHANQLQHALGMSMVAAGWTTTANNYFSRVSKDRIIAAVREGKDDKHADRIADLKKAPMALEAERLLQGTGWIPEPLRQMPDCDAGDLLCSDSTGIEDQLPN